MLSFFNLLGPFANFRKQLKIGAWRGSKSAFAFCKIHFPNLAQMVWFWKLFWPYSAEARHKVEGADVLLRSSWVTWSTIQQSHSDASVWISVRFNMRRAGSKVWHKLSNFLQSATLTMYDEIWPSRNTSRNNPKHTTMGFWLRYIQLRALFQELLNQVPAWWVRGQLVSRPLSPDDIWTSVRDSVQQYTRGQWPLCKHSATTIASIPQLWSGTLLHTITTYYY